MNRRELLLGASALLLTARARAQPEQPAALWSELERGGVVLLLRHAQTEAGVGDPPGFRIGDCSTQRNLSDEGRRQARRIGAALAARPVRIDQVLSSQWCRCLDTARLAFPKVVVEPYPALNSFFEDRATEPQQTREAAARIAAVRAPANVVFVTHQVNIIALAGVSVAPGEAVLARSAGGSVRVLGRLAL
ncbi:MAG: histidine phosphatase family protein [Betaproteobacteria bacterium]